MANYLTYPCKHLRITQTYYGGRSHKPHTYGNFVDYPWDEGGAGSGTSGGAEVFYCPCNEMIVKRIYGVGGSGVNTIFLESTSPVVFADGGTDYVSIQVTHSNDADLKGYKVGQKFTRGTAICKEGTDGGVDAHLHLSAGKGTFSTDLCWGTNSNGKSCIRTTKGTFKPEELFYIDTNFTTPKHNAGLNFKNLPPDAVIDDTSTLSNGTYQIDRSAKYDAVDTEILWKFLLIYFENPYAVAGIMGNMYYESRFYSSSIEGNTSDDRTLSTKYTQKVDDGTYDRTYFINDGNGKTQGYGLVGWTDKGLKEGLYDYWQTVGGSISSPYTQIEYLFEIISTKKNYATLYKELKEADTVRKASDAFVTKFEICQGCYTEEVQSKRANQGQTYYDLYKDITVEQAKAEFSFTEQTIIEDYFDMAVKIQWMAIGIAEET